MKKSILVLTAVLLMSACGRIEGRTVLQRCNLVKDEDSLVLVCPDTPKIALPSPESSPKPTIEPSSSPEATFRPQSITDISAATFAQCAFGGTVIKTSVDENDDGLVNEGDSSIKEAILCNQSHQIVEIVDPCGDAPNIYDEVIVKMQDGKLLASFSDNSSGKNTRFSLLVPGQYITTDGSNCRFSVTPAGEVTW